MGHIVVRDFTDLEDNRHIYRAGDKFPRAGVSVSEERVASLASKNNARGEALICGDGSEKPQNGRKGASKGEADKLPDKTVKKPKKAKTKEK